MYNMTKRSYVLVFPFLLFSLTARYCCLYCHIPKDSMKNAPTDVDPPEKRTLESIDADYRAYLADGSRKARAKDVSHSIIAKPLINIPLDHVSIHVYMYIYTFQLT